MEFIANPRILADGEGFEPPVELPPQRFSRPPHSTALPPILNSFTDGLSTYGFVRLTHLAVLLTTRSFSTSLCLSRRLVCKTAAFDRSATHPKLFYRRSFNLRFCSLFTPIGAAHHSFFLDFALLVSQTRMQDRRYCPALPPIQNFLTNLRFTIYYAFSFRKAFIRFFITEFTNKLIPIKNIINDNS